jgi:uracil-DNA glycosylase
MKKSKLQSLMKPNWADALYPYFQTEAFKILNNKIIKDRETTEVYPLKENIFRVFSETDLNEVKVNIIGMDPYHNKYSDGSCAALGRAFACNRHYGMQPSLRNIIIELEDDIGVAPGFDHTLQHWVDQGVLLLNTALTVCKSDAGSHTKVWKEFTIAVCEALNTQDNIVHILWGNHAKSFKKYFTNTTHKFIESTHPSPFSCKNFFGTKPFSRANNYLLHAINWTGNKDFAPVEITMSNPPHKAAYKIDGKVTPGSTWRNGEWVSHKDIKILPYEGQEEE